MIIQEDEDAISLGASSSVLEESSEPDDKTSATYQLFDNQNYSNLPENVVAAIEQAREKQKHSAFYYTLRGLNEKIKIYKGNFLNKIPRHQRQFQKAM